MMSYHRTRVAQYALEKVKLASWSLLSHCITLGDETSHTFPFVCLSAPPCPCPMPRLELMDHPNFAFAFNVEYSHTFEMQIGVHQPYPKPLKRVRDQCRSKP